MESESKVKEESIVEFGLASDEKKIIKFLDKVNSIPVNKMEEWQAEFVDFFSNELIVPYMIVYSSKYHDDKEIQKRVNKIKDSFFKDIINGKVIHVSLDICYTNLMRVRESLKIGVSINRYLEWFFLHNNMLRSYAVKCVSNQDARFQKFGVGVTPRQREYKRTDGFLLYETIYFILPDNGVDYPLDEWGDRISKSFFEKLIKKPKKNNNKRTPIDSRLRHECFKRDKYTCVECGATNKEKMLHADHILPVSQGGNDELDNLQTLCEHCNLSKSNKKWKNGCKKMNKK